MSLLVLVVVLGGLAALAVAGVSQLNDTTNTVAAITNTTVAGAVSTSTRAQSIGGSGVLHGAGCTASADAARAATAVAYVNNAGAYPTRWTDMTTSNPPVLELPLGVKVNAANPSELDGFGWKLIMAGGGATQPTFTCQTTTP